MGVSRVATQIDIAIQGLRLESKRMKVIAENIANARTSRTETGGPYRRKQVVLETSRGQAAPKVVADMSTAFKSVYEPGNPDADAAGLVRMPNVDLPMELIDMVVASRAYQANAAVLKRYQDMVAATLELLR
jgi:flagellar basal-body rod protein FlgC